MNAVIQSPGEERISKDTAGRKSGGKPPFLTCEDADLIKFRLRYLIDSRPGTHTLQLELNNSVSLQVRKGGLPPLLS